MEKNIVIIDLEIYTDLIRKDEENKNYIMNLENELRNVKNEQKMVYDTIYSKIYENNKWELNNLISNEKDNYSRNQLIDTFKKYGFYSLDLINDAINMMLTKLGNEQKEEKDKDE